MRSALLVAGLVSAVSLASLPGDALAQAKPAIGFDPEQVLAMAKKRGTSTMGKDAAGNPLITAVADGLNYNIYFYNCATPRRCGALQYNASWTGAKVTAADLNAWNRDKLHGRAYLDAKENANFDLVVAHARGMVPEALDDSFRLWGSLTKEYGKILAK